MKIRSEFIGPSATMRVSYLKCFFFQQKLWVTNKRPPEPTVRPEAKDLEHKERPVVAVIAGAREMSF